MTTKRILLPGAVALAVVTVVSGCTPDVTRERVQNDISTTFVHSYKTSQAMQDKPIEAPKLSSTECHNELNKVADAGPGSWSCEIKYTGSNGERHDDEFVVLVDSLACYQAFNGEKRDQEILDTTTHRKVPDPAVGFDGCFNVYDGRTNTAK
ncbi:MAG: hypothetical protein ACRDO0_00050 [Nocardioidaceae bacterium]